MPNNPELLDFGTPFALSQPIRSFIVLNHRIMRTGIGALAVLLLWGCGNPFARREFSPLGAKSRSFSTTSADIAPGYSCPLSPNVKNTRTGDAAIFACASAQNSSDVALLVEAPLQSVCVFPAQVVDATHVYWKIDPATGGPMVKCGALPASISFYDPILPAIFSFPSTNYNAVYVVDQVDREDMNLCMVMGQGYCPSDYYFGKFR